MNFRLMTSLLPVVAFYALTRVADPWVAILGGFIVSAGVYWYNRHDRLIGMLTAFAFVVVAVTAGIGIVANNEKAYLASGPVQDFLFVLLYLGSMVARRPLIGAISRELAPALMKNVPSTARVFFMLTLAWAGFDLFSGVVRLVMLQELSVGQYLIASRIAFMPLSALMIAGSLALVIREARRRDPEIAARPTWEILLPERV